MEVYQSDSCIERSQVEGREGIILSDDYDFAVMADGRDTGGSRSAVLIIKGYKSIILVNTMTTRLWDATKSYRLTSKVKRSFQDKLNKLLQSR